MPSALEPRSIRHGSRRFPPTATDSAPSGTNAERWQRHARSLFQTGAGGKPYVVDLDSAQFFDRIHHDHPIARVGEQVPDRRIPRLIGMTLRSGVLANGLMSPTTEGTVQGNPLSPLLGNIVLDEPDRERDRRGLACCRFADDCNIFVRTPKAAERVMAGISGIIETRLEPVVNREKSPMTGSGRPDPIGSNSSAYTWWARRSRSHTLPGNGRWTRSRNRHRAAPT